MLIDYSESTTVLVRYWQNVEKMWRKMLLSTILLGQKCGKLKKKCGKLRSFPQNASFFKGYAKLFGQKANNS